MHFKSLSMQLVLRGSHAMHSMRRDALNQFLSGCTSLLCGEEEEEEAEEEEDEEEGKEKEKGGMGVGEGWRGGAGVDGEGRSQTPHS